MCTHHLWDDPSGLLCIRSGPHTTHIYEDTHGSSVPDRKEETS